MNLRQLRQNQALREKLAAEYALGTLKGGARRRFEGWVRDDAMLQRSVAEWQDRLNPMIEFVPPAQPAPEVWQSIEKALKLDRPASTPAAPSRPARGSPGFWSSLAFWRGLGMASTLLATLLVAVLLIRQPDVAQPEATYVAMLADDKAEPIMLITGDPGQRRMRIKVIRPTAVTDDRSLELWALPKSGPPRSLGLVSGQREETLPLPADTSPESVPMLAITLEPKGGSGNPNAASGPILFKGPWVQL